MTVAGSTSTSGGESLSDIHATATASSVGALGALGQAKKKSRQLSILRPTSSDGYATTISKSGAERIIKAEVEVALARYEPLERIFDPFNVSALLISHPAIGPYIPMTTQAVYDKYVKPIDKEVTGQLVELMKHQPGDITCNFDGVSVNGKSKNLFTASIGPVSMFLTYIDLGSGVHVTNAEVASAFGVCKAVKEQFDNRGICAIAVDNAASAVAKKVSYMLSILPPPRHRFALFLLSLTPSILLSFQLLHLNFRSLISWWMKKVTTPSESETQLIVLTSVLRI